jgi:ABC-type branched-subunit amino acid transport system substrate-binding protein
MAIEFIVLRRLYARDHLDQVLATFGLILFFNQSIILIFGRQPMFVNIPPFFQGAIELLPGVPYPIYRLVIIAVGVVVALGLWVLITRTRIGMLVRAGATNREMVRALGVDIRDGFNLAVKHSGGKLGGINLDLQVVDDQLKPDVAKQVADRFLQQQKSHVITGVVFTNILLPILPSILDSKTVYISPNTGPNDYAGAKCNPNFFVASWQSEDIPSAMGKFVSERGIKNVYLIGANYPGGRENLSGFKRLYKGNIVDEVYTPMNQLDFSVDLATMQSKKPEAVFIFLPGGMGRRPASGAAEAKAGIKAGHCGSARRPAPTAVIYKG